MITEIAATCAFEGCQEKATHIACGRTGCGLGPYHPDPACYCKPHANLVMDEGDPEYHDVCPNCGCCFGIN